MRKKISAARLRDEILSRLKFQPELMICSAEEVLVLAEGDWFRNAPAGKEFARFVSVLQRTPRATPRLPIERPVGKNWEVQILALTGRFAISVRRVGKTYSNAVVEKELGLPATTRNWNTIEAIRAALGKEGLEP